MSRTRKPHAGKTALFRTDDLNLAAYLVASRSLLFHHAKRGRPAEFFFHDPYDFGGPIATAFMVGDLKASANMLRVARSDLRESMKREDAM
jgi:hypothetical protein